MTTEPHDPLLTREEVAELIRTPAKTLAYWQTAGKGPPCFRVGKRVLYRTSEVQRWLQALESTSAA